jgi:hypothetical protein
VLKDFQQLGDAVASAWKAANYDEAVFPEIATTALKNSQVLTTIDTRELIRWLMEGDGIPDQRPSEFGQPPINLYVGERFYIQALFWIDSTTAIHEHSFSGAFGVFAGSSVHSTYSFRPEKVVSERLVLGETNFLSSELLERGDIRTIHSGDKLIHALFHLDRPSVSLVVRTSHKISDRPQYTYTRPYIAFDDLNLPPLHVIRVQMLESLFHSNLELFWESAGQIVAKCDPFILIQVLNIAYRVSDDRENWTRLLEQVSDKNKELIPYIVPSLKENVRINRIVGLRSLVHNPTHRFFLALLLNVPLREEIYKLIARRFPAEDPQKLALSWLGEIFSESRAGITLTPPLLFVIERILLDPDFNQSRPALKEYFQTEQESDLAKLNGLWQQLHSLDVLQPLYASALVQ